MMNSPQEQEDIRPSSRHPPTTHCGFGSEERKTSLVPLFAKTMDDSSDGLPSIFQNILMKSFAESMFHLEDHHQESGMMLHNIDDQYHLVKKNPRGRAFFDNDQVECENFGEDSSLLSEDDDLFPTPIDATRIQVVDGLLLKDSLLEQASESFIDDVRQLFRAGREDREDYAPDSSIQRKRKMNDELHQVPMEQFNAQSHKDNKRQRVALVHGDPAATEEGHESRGSATSSANSSSSSSQPRHCSQWQETYEELCQFQKVEGHCNVPPRYNNDPTLWRWVKRQRYQYKRRQDGRNPHAISDERIAALERIGFVWDSQGTLWTERLKELEQFRTIHGHCNVPSKYPTNPQLSTWVKCQRRQYKLYRDTVDGSKKSNMTEERIEALDKLGFVFDPRGGCKVRQEKH